MPVEVNIEGDINKFYEVARKDVAKLIEGAAVKGAAIFNASGSNVTFYAYNYIDTVYWVSAMKVLVASGNYGTVAASGTFFKIHPNDHKNEEFLVEPGHAYVYKGPGKLEKAA